MKKQLFLNRTLSKPNGDFCTNTGTVFEAPNIGAALVDALLQAITSSGVTIQTDISKFTNTHTTAHYPEPTCTSCDIMLKYRGRPMTARLNVIGPREDHSYDAGISDIKPLKRSSPKTRINIPAVEVVRLPTQGSQLGLKHTSS